MIGKLIKTLSRVKRKTYLSYELITDVPNILFFYDFLKLQLFKILNLIACMYTYISKIPEYLIADMRR